MQKDKNSHPGADAMRSAASEVWEQGVQDADALARKQKEAAAARVDDLLTNANKIDGGSDPDPNSPPPGWTLAAWLDFLETSRRG